MTDDVPNSSTHSFSTQLQSMAKIPEFTFGSIQSIKRTGGEGERRKKEEEEEDEKGRKMKVEGRRRSRRSKRRRKRK